MVKPFKNLHQNQRADDLSTKVAHIGLPSIYYFIVFSETIWLMELNFHMKTPYDKLAEIYTNCSGHVCYKKPFKNLLENQKAHYLGTWYVAWGCGAYLVCSKYDPRLTLTYYMSRSNWLPNAFKWNFF